MDSEGDSRFAFCNDRFEEVKVVSIACLTLLMDATDLSLCKD